MKTKTLFTVFLLVSMLFLTQFYLAQLPKETEAQKAGRLTDIGKSQRPLTDLEMELYRTKRELAEVKMERDILKKAAAYFAKESLPGTR